MKDVFPVTAQFLGVRSTFLRTLNHQSLNRQHELPQVHPRFLAGASVAFAYSRLALIYLISLHRHEFVLRKICSSILECATDAKRNWYLVETTRSYNTYSFSLSYSSTSSTISITARGHSCAQIPQPLQ